MRNLDRFALKTTPATVPKREKHLNVRVNTKPTEAQNRKHLPDQNSETKMTG